VKWRDALLTLFAWVAFVVFIAVEFKLSLGYLRALETGRAHLAVDMRPDLERLAPFFLVGALLAAFLFVRSARTSIERSKALKIPQPAALATADEARDAGIDEAALIAARDQQIVVVHRDVGGLRIEPGSQS
jgi:hypothetical protein